MKLQTLFLPLFLFSCSPAVVTARDIGPPLGLRSQWEDQDKRLREWFNSVKRPDLPNVSCCGEADAFRVAVLSETATEVTVQVIEPNRFLPEVKVGRVFKFSRNALQHRYGNAVGVPLIFITLHNEQVVCFIPSADGV